MKLSDDLLYNIFAVLEEIPIGKVATYGQIASLIGYEKNSRLVGKAMSLASFYGTFPCHRVVNSKGRLVPLWEGQRQLLEKEGITFKNNGHVYLDKHQWKV